MTKIWALMPDSPSPKPFDAGPGLIAVGSEITGSALAGILLDFWLNTGPWLTITLTGLGGLAGIVMTVRLLKKEAESKKAK